MKYVAVIGKRGQCILQIYVWAFLQLLPTTAKDSFHGTSISLFQHPSTSPRNFRRQKAIAADNAAED
jgi:hypothetical protein